MLFLLPTVYLPTFSIGVVNKLLIIENQGLYILRWRLGFYLSVVEKKIRFRLSVVSSEADPEWMTS